MAEENGITDRRVAAEIGQQVISWGRRACKALGVTRYQCYDDAEKEEERGLGRSASSFAYYPFIF